MSLISAYFGQHVRKCSSVSTSFPVQWGHSRSSLGSQVCLCLPVSIVVYQGPNQTNQDSIEAWLKHEEPNSTRQQQEVINQTLAPARLNTACNSKTKGTLNDNSNAGIW